MMKSYSDFCKINPSIFYPLIYFKIFENPIYYHPLPFYAILTKCLPLPQLMAPFKQRKETLKSVELEGALLSCSESLFNNQVAIRNSKLSKRRKDCSIPKFIIKHLQSCDEMLRFAEFLATLFLGRG